MRWFSLLSLSFAAALAFGCDDPKSQTTSGDTGGGAGGTGGGGADAGAAGTGGGAAGDSGGTGGAASDSTLLYLGTLDDYPMAIDAKKDVIAVLIEGVIMPKDARLSFLSINGGALQPQGTAPTGYPSMWPVVTDGDHIACAIPDVNQDAGTLVVTSPGAGASTTLFDLSDPHPVHQILGIHGDRILFVGDGLQAIPVAGGPIETLAADFKAPAVASETNAFGFTAQDTVVTVPLDGGAPEDLGALGTNAIDALAASGGDVYFITETADAGKNEVLALSAGGGSLRSVTKGPYISIAADGGDLFLGKGKTGVGDAGLIVVVDSATGDTKKTLSLPPTFQTFLRIVAPPGSPYVVTLVDAVEKIDGGGFSSRNEILRLSR